MGCDITMYIEKNTDEVYNIWENVSLYRVGKYSHNLEKVSPYNGRNYELFSILAGVRGWHEPLIEPRGLPENLSREVEKEERWWEKEYHTPTWYDLKELLLYREMYKDNEDYKVFEDFVGNILYYLELAEEYVWVDVPPNKYRVIMWFDS